ncbi:MAG: flagellar type III secretion system protein FlhB [Pseudomonadota bacterium]
MSEKPDDFQHTEEPTQKRLDDARKKGDAPKSQEVVAAAMLAAAALVGWLFAGGAAKGVAASGLAFIDRPHDLMVDGAALNALFSSVAIKLAAALALPAALFFGFAFLSNVAQAAPVFAPDRLKPQWSRLSPIAGAKRVFGPSGLFNFAKGVGKITLVGSVLVFALWPDRDLLTAAIYGDARGLLDHMMAMILKLIGLSVAAMIALAALDAMYQRRAWRKRLRMTKEEIRRELKETEGDPQIKARLRGQREALSRRRMMVAVEDATVLIMNPTHYAVALKYEFGDAAAPVCVAKGVDALALRMRAVANDNGVPVVENPPLARALHAAAELDQEIPIEHYEAVAKVIGVIMRGAGRTP